MYGEDMCMASVTCFHKRVMNENISEDEGDDVSF
jgi:hypothetical protein